MKIIKYFNEKSLTEFFKNGSLVKKSIKIRKINGNTIVVVLSLKMAGLSLNTTRRFPSINPSNHDLIVSQN